MSSTSEQPATADERPHWLVLLPVRLLGVAFMFGGLWTFLEGGNYAGPPASLLGVELLLRPATARRFVPSVDAVVEMLRRWRGGTEP
jgi:hypothetical protein